MFEISVAPMLGLTNRHCRYFYRLLSKNVLLYTEMVPAAAIVRGKAAKLFNYNPTEKPLAVQLAGSEPKLLAACAVIVESAGFDEINLNVGCPSKRAQAGGFGAFLMTQPELVAESVSEMRAKVSIPVSVKTRLGIGAETDYAKLYDFIELLQAAGCSKVIVHARNAKLSSFTPKQNRRLLPLQYELVYKLQQDFAELPIILNGEVNNIADIKTHQPHVAGVMLGRGLYRNPYMLAAIEQEFFRTTEFLTRKEWFEAYLPYIGEQLKLGCNRLLLTRHLLGLYHGLPGAAEWRRQVCTEYFPAQMADYFSEVKNQVIG